jgi:RecA-family ATPase
VALKFVSGKEFLEEEADFEWVIPPFVAAGSNMMLYGRQGLGKSSIMMQLVHSVGEGVPWMGYPVHKKGKTLYLGLDMSDMETRMILERAADAGMNVVTAATPLDEYA